MRFRFYHFRDALEKEANKNNVHYNTLQDAELVIARLVPKKPCLGLEQCGKKGKCESCKGPTTLLFQNRDYVSE